MLAKMARLHPAIACWEHLHGQQLGLHGVSLLGRETGVLETAIAGKVSQQPLLKLSQSV